MPKWFPKSCRRCHVHVDDGAVISRRGYCYPCGTLRNEWGQRRMAEMSRGNFAEAEKYATLLIESLPAPRVGGTPSQSRFRSTATPKAQPG